MSKQIVDIVIPTCRPDEKLTALLKRLGKQSYPIRHVYIINTRSDRFPEELDDMPGIIVKHIEPEEFDHGGTRDCGMQLSDADIVVFMTQDAVPADEYLVERLLRPFSDKAVAVSYARQLPDRTCDVIERYTRAFNYPDQCIIKSRADLEELGIKTFFCSNVCAAYRSDIYKSSAGFTKKTIFNEDMVYAGIMIYAGLKIAYQADAQVIHSHNYSGIQQFHRNFDLAVSQVDNPEVFAKVRAESEGIKLVKRTVKYLITIKKIHLVPVLIYKSGCKYIGYKLGQKYKSLPLWLVKKCTMNTKYWEKSHNN